jgi:hypothetical protein
MNTLALVISTMLASGVVGGLINSFLNDPNIEKPLKWWQHIVVGIGAAFIVPVFLNMISSTLISDISGEVTDSKMLSKVLVLAGFCLLAAISSRAFIRSLTDRLLQEVKEAKKEAKEAKEQSTQAENIAFLTVENDTPNFTPANFEALAATSITDEEKKILETMVESQFSMRSITGIAKDSGLAKEKVNVAISSLLGKELIAEGKNKEGQLRWYPTTKGRGIISDT